MENQQHEEKKLTFSLAHAHRQIWSIMDKAKSFSWWLMCDVIASDAHTIAAYVWSSRLEQNRAAFENCKIQNAEREIYDGKTEKSRRRKIEWSDLFKIESTSSKKKKKN